MGPPHSILLVLIMRLPNGTYFTDSLIMYPVCSSVNALEYEVRQVDTGSEVPAK